MNHTITPLLVGLVNSMTVREVRQAFTDAELDRLGDRFVDAYWAVGAECDRMESAVECLAEAGACLGSNNPYLAIQIADVTRAQKALLRDAKTADRVIGAADDKIIKAMCW